MEKQGMKICFEREMDMSCFCEQLRDCNWKVVIELSGDAVIGRDINIGSKDLKGIIDKLNQKHPDNFIKCFCKCPSIEKLAKYFVDELLTLVYNCKSIKRILIKVYESEDCYVEEIIDVDDIRYWNYMKREYGVDKSDVVHLFGINWFVGGGSR